MPRDTFAAPPDPAEAGTVDDLVERLRLLKVWAGDPSYETIKERVNAAWTTQGRPAGELARRSTVANCFQSGRRRLNTDLVVAVVQALRDDTGYVTQWRQALRVIGREVEAVSQVRVQDSLPQDLVGFTGRTDELKRLSDAVRQATGAGSAVVISAIEGMAGVGKTQLAVHAGQQLLREEQFDRVLFVNLRGFHPDPTQPPADPAAVLDGFLRLLGMPGHQIPHRLAARAAAYRNRLAGARALIVLDNAATADQVRPLLADVPGCVTLVTSRRSLADLHPTARLTVDVFDPDEATAFLTAAVSEQPVGPHPDAIARIARRCGYLPLALGLIAGHIRNTAGWTLTDHADRLDERHRDRRLEAGVELALDLSYRHLPADQQRLLRLVALHPGQDFDAYAAAALTDTALDTAEACLGALFRDHLIQQATAGRYVLHDLVRAYATARAHDHDSPPARRAALTRLFDYYLATTAAAMEILLPGEANVRPHVSPAGTPVPPLTDRPDALDWLDTERPTLVAVADHTATHGWPDHTTRLARTLSRYLQGGHHNDALTVHGHAHRAARDSGDLKGQAHALSGLAIAHLRLGRPDPADDHLRQALELFRQTADTAGQARALFNIGLIAERAGRYPDAIAYKQQALELDRRNGDRIGEATTLGGLGAVMERAGRLDEAADYYRQSLTVSRQTGNPRGEALALHGLGELAVRMGRYEPAGDHLEQALRLYRQIGDRTSEAGALESLGSLHTRLDRLDEATEYYRQALTVFQETGNQDNEAWVCNGLGEVSRAAGRTADALTHHTAAHAIASVTGNRHQQARAHAGLGDVHRALADPGRARDEYRQALTHYVDLGLPEADQIRLHLAELDAADQN
ncbi:tetratricopeptide repeat protein [Actinoplanes flavus]|uniref:Tetratricopeptide repeat protein n=1 Tax=Actinoplanes flavus TaxID=2820290 RepID=A0ABS3UKL3_9ACTN|nr:tetratricopeptide repeat protein [Actinoplanes flavus]MBO3739333.1 tetratricopeptide repeat protein [Actinoplanes flavus]